MRMSRGSSRINMALSSLRKKYIVRVLLVVCVCCTILLLLLAVVTCSTLSTTAGTTPSTLGTRSASAPPIDIDMWLAGMAADADKIHSNMKETLITLNCNHHVGIHIILKLSHQVHSFQRELHSMQNGNGNGNHCQHSGCCCAPIVILSQDHLESYHTQIQNRIDRLAMLRDAQRSALYPIYSFYRHTHNQNQNQKPGIIILADLDLFQLPNISLITEQANQMQQRSYPHDAICAAGITMTNIGNKNTDSDTAEPWYYDTFATVFLPDTFSHPTKRRLVPLLYHGEDPHLVRSNDQHGNFTQGDIYRYFQTQSQSQSQSESQGLKKKKTTAASTRTVRVKSCFGGMAMYRAASYFEQYCHYQLQDSIRDQLEHWSGNSNDNIDYNSAKNDIHRDATSKRGMFQVDVSKSILRYANNKERRPCEHVVFHDCLMKVTTGQFNIAVNPALKTYWKRDF